MSLADWCMELVPLGEDRTSETSTGLVLRYGTSLKLMASASEVLVEEFKTDPQKDWEKQAEHGRHFFYVTVENQFGETLSALRAILEGGSSSSGGGDDEQQQQQQSRTIIDQVATIPDARGCGHAMTLIEFIQSWAACMATDMYVLALQDAAPFWMDRGYLLEQDPSLQHYNDYNDAFLLKLPSNQSGSTCRAYIPPDPDDDDEDDDSDDSDDEL